MSRNRKSLNRPIYAPSEHYFEKLLGFLYGIYNNKKYLCELESNKSIHKNNILYSFPPIGK